MRPTIAELAARQQIQQTGLDAHARQTMGMPMKILKAHLQVADRLLQGDTSILSSPKLRNWLYAQAEASGKTRQEVDQVIREVLDAPSPQARVERYALALSDDPGAAHRGLALAQRYQNESVVDRVSTKLQAQDAQLKRSGSTFDLPDDEGRMAQARQEAGAVRQALEAAAVSSGIAADRPQSLRDHQVRAQIYANRAADKLEDNSRRREAGQRVDMRDDIEAAFMADRALHAKVDAGIGSDRSMADINERVDSHHAIIEGAMEEVERQ
jgi:hypothetical protein